jgi:hypothetical protein
MQHQLLKKNNYLFKQGDHHKRFFGLICGKISIRTIVKNELDEKKEMLPSQSNAQLNGYYSNNNVNADKGRRKIDYESPDLLKEEILAIITGGHCLGHYAVAYDIPRTASAYAIEDTDLFYLDKSYFEISFQKDIVKADQDRRLFLLERLPILKNITKMEDYVTRLVPIVIIFNVSFPVKVILYILK